MESVLCSFVLLQLLQVDKPCDRSARKQLWSCKGMGNHLHSPYHQGAILQTSRYLNGCCCNDFCFTLDLMDASSWCGVVHVSDRVTPHGGDSCLTHRSIVHCRSTAPAQAVSAAWSRLLAVFSPVFAFFNALQRFRQQTIAA